MFPEKAPFGISYLNNAPLRTTIKKAVMNKSFLVTPDELRKIMLFNKNAHDAFCIASTLLMFIDEYASHSLVVLKSLSILQSQIVQNTNDFVGACRQMLPEIRSILLLSFDVKTDKFRDQIHNKVRAIYEFLAFKVSMTQSDDINVSGISDNDLVAKPRARPRIPAPNFEIFEKNAANEGMDVAELGFDFKTLSQNKQLRNSFNPFSSANDLMTFTPVQVEPEEPIEAGELLDSIVIATKEEPEPAKEEVKPEGWDNPREVELCSDLQLIKKSQYDETIESY